MAAAGRWPPLAAPPLLPAAAARSGWRGPSLLAPLAAAAQGACVGAACACLALQGQGRRRAGRAGERRRERRRAARAPPLGARAAQRWGRASRSLHCTPQHGGRREGAWRARAAALAAVAPLVGLRRAHHDPAVPWGLPRAAGRVQASAGGGAPAQVAPWRVPGRPARAHGWGWARGDRREWSAVILPPPRLPPPKNDARAPAAGTPALFPVRPRSRRGCGQRWARVGAHERRGAPAPLPPPPP